MAKKPIPTEANPHPATSSYLKAPKAIKAHPTKIIIKVAQANTVFLFIIGLFILALPRSLDGRACLPTAKISAVHGTDLNP